MPAAQNILDKQNVGASTPYSIFLFELFKRLDEAGIAYCVMRGYGTLPYSIAHDIDFQIDHRKYKEYLSVLYQSAEELGWAVVRRRFRFGRHFNSLIYQDKDQFAKIPIDAELRTQWKAMKYASNRAILATRKKYNGFWVASSGSESAISLLKEYLHFGKVKDKGDGKHKRRFAQLAREDPENFIETIEPHFGGRISRFALQCAQKEDWETFEKNAGKVRRTLILRALMRRPIGQLIDWARFLWGHFSDKVLHPSGLFVCLIGPDGSGKTTISRGLERDMTDVFSKVRYFHGHLGIIPPLKKYYNLVARLLGKPEKKVTSDDVMQNVDMLPFNPLRAIVYVLYYSVDYFLGHFTIWRAKGHGQLVLFDRYFYDYFIQQVHSRNPRWLLRSILRLIPKPDLIIWLRNEPEVIHRRKPELTPSEVRQQNQVCMDLICRYANAYSVQTDNDPEITLHHVREIIFRFMAQRVKTRERM